MRETQRRDQHKGLVSILVPQRQDLYNGFGNALAKAFELALTPAIFGFFGWLLDRWLGTAPLFLIAFIVIVFTYCAWKLAAGYDADMRRQEQELLDPPSPAEGRPRVTAAMPADTPAVERDLALDMVRRALPAAPVIVALAALIWGADGAWSAMLAVGIVLVNLVLAALSLSWAAKVSLSMLYVAALGGFLVRMGLVVAVIFVVKDSAWVNLTALGICVLVTHLGLLIWETRYISANLAFPGLKPGTPKEATSPR